MKNFKFPLETLLKLRERVRDERRGQLAQAYEAQQMLADQQSQLSEEHRHVRRHGRRASQPGELNVDRLLEQHRYSLLLQTKLEIMRQQEAALAEEVERRRLALQEADTEVRAIERLRERRLEDHQQRERRREQIEADENAVTHWNAGAKS